jgi:YegS/Rv2252/BmrU family lipid kinase
MAYATLIHCPRGGSASQEEHERACSLLREKLDLEVSEVPEGTSPAVLAHEAVARGSKLLIASGGDGTVSAVGGAIIGRADCVLGILPRGTANSIATHLGVPRPTDEACAVILGGQTHIMDTGMVNDRPMLLMATIGLHAEAITEVDPDMKKRFGALAYMLEEVDRMREGELFEVTIEAHGQRASFEANAVTVANIARPVTLLAQGPATIEDDDGMLDVTLVAIRGFAEAVATSLHLATRALTQTAAERENIGHFRTAQIRIETREPKRVMIDGEDADETPLLIRCLPKSLRVLVP